MVGRQMGKSWAKEVKIGGRGRRAKTRDPFATVTFLRPTRLPPTRFGPLHDGQDRLDRPQLTAVTRSSAADLLEPAKMGAGYDAEPQPAAEHFLPAADFAYTRGAYLLHPNGFAPSAATAAGAAYRAPPADPSYLVAQQSERLQQLLSKRLGAELVASRKGAGSSDVSYIEGWRAIELANEVLGFNGWSSEIKEDAVMVDSYNEQSQRWDIMIKCIVRVWLRDGTSHEDVGYGKMENSKSRLDAFEKVRSLGLVVMSHADETLRQAHKEAVTDGLKRALRQFGNVLGNCLYDKNYLGVLKNMKAQKVSRCLLQASQRLRPRRSRRFSLPRCTTWATACRCLQRPALHDPKRLPLRLLQRPSPVPLVLLRTLPHLPPEPKPLRLASLPSLKPSKKTPSLRNPKLSPTVLPRLIIVKVR